MRLATVPPLLTILPFLLLTGLVGCGGGENTSAGNATGGARAGGQGGGTGGTGGGSALGGGSGSGGAGLAGAGGGASGGAGGGDAAPDLSPEVAQAEVSVDVVPPDGICTAGAACSVAGKNGICAGAVCTACVDPTGDPGCAAAYGAGALCIEGSCVPTACRDSRTCTAGQLCNLINHQCGACGGDPACKMDTTAYGAGFLCLAGKCVKGDCHDSSGDCAPGNICGVSKPQTCGPCTTSAQCTADTQRYGAGYVCNDNGKCAKGDCGGSSAECTGGKDGLICGVSTPNTCQSCTQDGQCRNDPRYKDSKPMCFTAAGPESGHCVANTCTTNNQKCPGNPADFCCASKCIPGSCCDGDDTPCKLLGSTYTCVKNTCTTCDPIAGNQYFVDPINGNDTIATGSGNGGGTTSASCMFKTLTQALDRLPDNAPVGTVITIVGAAGATTDLLVTGAGAEKFPIIIPANVKITTKTGPIALKLPKDKIGFSLRGNAAALLPDPTAGLTIDGGGVSASAVVFEMGATDAASIAQVAVKKTNDDGIRVTLGTAHIGGGVSVIDSGTPTQLRNGLEITGGRASIDVPVGQKTLFQRNSLHGIIVTGKGELDILGKAAGTPGEGNGSVVVRDNGDAGIHLAQTPTDATRKSNDIKGVVAHANSGPGLRVLGGTKLELRESVLLANGGSAVLIEPFGTSAEGKDVTNIDLGIAANLGKNVLQTLLGSNPNTGAGICVDLNLASGDVTIKARGNTFAGTNAALDCSVTPAPATKLVIADNCGRVNVGVRKAVASTASIKVDVLNCATE